MALRFCLSGKGGFLPPADPSQPCTEQDSCLEGLQKCFISYLWPRFLHVPFLQVVSRKLWHQLEQPKRREKRAASDGGHWGGSRACGTGLGAHWKESPRRARPRPRAHPTALAECRSPTPPKRSEEAGAETRSTCKHFTGKASSFQEKPLGQIPLRRSALARHLLHQTQWELLTQALKYNWPVKPH